MKCNLSTINGWCGISNKPCKECISPICKFIKKAYRQGRVEAEYFTSYMDDVEQWKRRYDEALSLAIKALERKEIDTENLIERTKEETVIENEHGLLGM